MLLNWITPNFAKHLNSCMPASSRCLRGEQNANLEGVNNVNSVISTAVPKENRPVCQNKICCDNLKSRINPSISFIHDPNAIQKRVLKVNQYIRSQEIQNIKQKLEISMIEITESEILNTLTEVDFNGIFKLKIFTT